MGFFDWLTGKKKEESAPQEAPAPAPETPAEPAPAPEEPAGEESSEGGEGGMM
ncbi:MAG: hypothetical protein U9Q03_04600 [Patescibacteria group bacterium]|nr:hypothetical protein [Patescibacteria group bacterium]